jgi:hypothetical protein
MGEERPLSLSLSHKEKKKEIFLQRKAEAAALGVSKKELKHANKLAKRLASMALTTGATTNAADTASGQVQGQEMVVISI